LFLAFVLLPALQVPAQDFFRTAITPFTRYWHEHPKRHAKFAQLANAVIVIAPHIRHLPERNVRQRVFYESRRINNGSLCDVSPVPASSDWSVRLLQATVTDDVRPYESIGRFSALKGGTHETDTLTYFGTVNRRASRSWVIAIEPGAWDRWKIEYRLRRQCKLPMSFEKNAGQTRSGVDFIARGSGYSIFLSAGEAVIAAKTHKLRDRIFDPGQALRKRCQDWHDARWFKAGARDCAGAVAWQSQLFFW
jgi:hypothetical protein